MATIIGRALILGGGSSPTPPGPTPISDLTGTIWLFNDTIDISTPFSYSYLNFNSLNYNKTEQSYSSLSVDIIPGDTALLYGAAERYSMGAWNF